jgi:tripartite-type tricarboxylate transporter receptor subunit TctC
VQKALGAQRRHILLQFLAEALTITFIGGVLGVVLALAEMLPDFEMIGWFAVVAPVGTPAAVVARLNKEINTLLADAETVQRMLTMGPMAEPLGSAEQFGAFLNREHERWSEVAREIGLLPE